MNQRATGENAVSRRTALMGLSAGAAAALWCAAAVPRAMAAGEDAGVESASEAVEKTQYGFLVDTRNCVNCQKCVAACRKANNTPDSTPARREVRLFESHFGAKAYLSYGCMHCEKPACAEVCPAGAISKRADGIVVVDSERCIGCKYCYQACPFSVPHYTKDGMDKCDCCLGAGVAPGDEPNCAAACMFGALHYGRLDDLQSSCGNTARKVESSTGPSYLLL